MIGQDRSPALIPRRASRTQVRLLFLARKAEASFSRGPGTCFVAQAVTGRLLLLQPAASPEQKPPRILGRLTTRLVFVTAEASDRIASHWLGSRLRSVARLLLSGSSTGRRQRRHRQRDRFGPTAAVGRRAGRWRISATCLQHGRLSLAPTPDLLTAQRSEGCVAPEMLLRSGAGAAATIAWHLSRVDMRLLDQACAGDGAGLVATSAAFVARRSQSWLRSACGSESSPARAIGYSSRSAPVSFSRVRSFRAVVYGSSAFRTAAQRRQLACEAALAVAADLGVTAAGAVIVEDWNNTIIRLGTTGVVAKVGTSHFRDARLESLERELAVSAYLAACGAPVVRPTEEVPAGPHRWRGLTLTLWEYVEPMHGAELRPAAAAAALKVVHEAMAGFDGRLPVFTVELDDAARLLQPDRSPELDATDRRFLLRVVGERRAALGPLGVKYRPLHGSPHGANWLLTADGPLLLDFETACLGPVEWDLSALGDDTIAYFPCADLELLDLLRRMRSICVAAKCWAAPERALELREAAHVHLKLLRGERLD